MSFRNELGKKGEQLAAEFLRKKGYTILQTNWRFEKAELDIIAQKDRLTVFVEVKTRKNEPPGNPMEMVHSAKQRHLHRAAEAFIERNRIETEIRFDIIAVLFHEVSPVMEHIEDAFFPK